MGGAAGGKLAGQAMLGGGYGFVASGKFDLQFSCSCA